jgi:acetolactate synthase-1/2/3 large subunit
MRKISAADYLVEFFIANGVTDVFGYQGGMVCHIFDSLGMYRDKISYHNCGNEQGAAFAACGYAQSTGKLGVCITTSGPGFTNALTGLANAWYDSIPVMLISGQVNTKDKRRNYTFRQFGFQEIQAVEMAKPIVKKVYEFDDNTDVVAELDDSYRTAFDGRKGPVYIDFPINIERNVVEIDKVQPIKLTEPDYFDASKYIEKLMRAEKPIIIAGAGINQEGLREEFRELINLLQIPVVPTMPADDVIPTDSPYRVDFMGGTGRREATIVLYNTDCVLALGTRLCNKCVGYNHTQFVPQATKFIRVDTDTKEFERQLKNFEEDVTADLRSFVKSALDYAKKNSSKYNHTRWVSAVGMMRKEMAPFDKSFGNNLFEAFTSLLPEDASITLDVGNNLIYGVQSSVIKNDTRVYISAGLGSMGYSIPAALGVAVGTHRATYAVTGDGGGLMNIQELNTIAKMQLPVKVLVLNNKALGHIIIFQEHYLDNRFVATKESENDYYSCDFAAVAKSFGMRSCTIHKISELEQHKDLLTDNKPALIEVEFENCPMLPNIHGGLNPYTNGPKLPDVVVAKVKQIMNI